MKPFWLHFLRRGIFQMARGKSLTKIGQLYGIDRRRRDKIPFLGDRLFRARILRKLQAWGNQHNGKTA